MWNEYQTKADILGSLFSRFKGRYGVENKESARMYRDVKQVPRLGIGDVTKAIPHDSYVKMADRPTIGR
jgi:hypothetical protein